MTEPAWTNGPWEIEQSQHGLWVGRFKDGSMREVVVYLETRELNDKAMACQIANAHLISAAPELYEALEFLLPWAEDGAEEGLHHHRNTDEGRRRCKEALLKCNEARAVLARARGEETK